MPLATILAPQILRRAQEIEAAVGTPRPMRAGYMQAGYEKTPYDPRGLVDKPEGGGYFDPETPAGREAVLMGQLQRSENPYTRTFANNYLQARDGTYKTPEPMPTSPAAPMKLVKKGDKVGTKGRVLQLDPAAAVGTNERGESVTAKGKKLGYLAQPSIETPSGSTQMRTGDRRARDITGGAWDNDAFSNAEMEKRYGKHFDAWNAYSGKGWPEGYFDGMSAEEKKAIMDGATEVQRRRDLAKKGIGA